MALKVDDLVTAILGAMRPVLKKHWEGAKSFVETESRAMAQTLQDIAELLAEGKITREQAKILAEMQAGSMRAVLLAVDGIGAIAAQRAISAAVDAVRDRVNGVAGFALL